MNEREPVDRLRAARWPQPSPDLRARVAAVAVAPPVVSWPERVWYSRRWRVGMAAAAVGIVALDVWAVPGSASVAAPALESARQAIEELVRSTGLPDDAAASIARRAQMSARTSAAGRTALIGFDQ